MIFVSTSCLRGAESRFEPSIIKVLEVYKKLGIKNIELGAAHKPVDSVKDMLEKCKKTEGNFICHTNFPPTGEKRMLNICSQDEEFRKLTLLSAKKSIEFLDKLGGKLFSLHSGYVADTAADGKPLTEAADREKAIETGANILGQICDYADEFDIRVAAENSPAGKFSVCSSPAEMKELLKLVSSRNLGMLLDLGHAALTEQKLGIERKEFVKLQDKVLEFHVHQVASGVDHKEVTDAKEVFRGFDTDALNEAALTLEANMLGEKQILSSLDRIKSALQ